MENNKEITIERNEIFYKIFFKNNEEIMLLLNPETFKILDCNLSACKFYGYSYEEMLKFDIFRLNTLGKEDVKKEVELTKIQNKNIFYFRHILADGLVKDVEVHSTLINIEGEKLLSLIVKDITDSKISSDKLMIENTFLQRTVIARSSELEKMNSLLDKSNNLFSAIIDSSSQIQIFALDCNYCYLKFNSKHMDIMKEITGKEIKIGMNMLDIIENYRDNIKMKTKFDRAIAGESFVKTEKYKHEKLSNMYWQDFYSPIYSKEGDIIGFSSFVMDITSRIIDKEKIRENERILRESQKVVHIGIYVNDVANDIWSSSEETNKIFGIDVNYEKTLENWIKIVHPDFREEVTEYVNNVYSNKKRFDYEYKIIRINDGKERWVHDIAEPELDEEGNLISMIGTIEDITERRARIIAREEEKKLLETTLRSIGDGVISTDNNGNIVLLNKAAEILTGWTQKESKGKPIDKVFNIINDTTREKCRRTVQRVLKSGNMQEVVHNSILVAKDGTERYVEDNTSLIVNENNSVSGMVLVFRDITEKKEKQKQIAKLSYHDYLTGLYNRRYYKKALDGLNIEKNLPLTVAMGDVNGLKLINDSFGHDMGDELIKKAAEIIKKGCRSGDIIARIGGDEFVILLPKTNEIEARKIIKHINNLAIKEKVCSIEVSISFGYGTKNNPEEKIEAIFKNAEDNMYKKKLFESPSMRGKTVSAIISTLHEKNKREERHSNRVSVLCESMGHALSLSQYEIDELKNVGLLHDIGKIAIDENILNKPGKLNEDEWNEIKKHPEIGYRILSTVNHMADIATYVLYHHERWDGKGYPKGLKGREIPFVSRVIAIADSFDAMTSDRSYRKALSTEIALDELQKNSGIQFDPELVKVFIEEVYHKGYCSLR